MPPFDGERTLADVVMAPTRIYVKQLLATMKVRDQGAIAHITGGGLRRAMHVLPENTVAELQSCWPSQLQPLSALNNLPALLVLPLDFLTILL